MIQPKVTRKYIRDIGVLCQVMDPMVVYQWLDEKIKGLLLDYINLKIYTSELAVTNLSDYSYIITPAFKALEGVLIKIGQELKLKRDGYSVGSMFNEDRINKYRHEVLDKLTHLDKEHKLKISQWLTTAKGYLDTLRNSPAHYEHENITNWNKAVREGDTILHTIDGLCRTLIENRLFPSLIMKEKERRKREKARIIGSL